MGAANKTLRADERHITKSASLGRAGGLKFAAAGSGIGLAARHPIGEPPDGGHRPRQGPYCLVAQQLSYFHVIVDWLRRCRGGSSICLAVRVRNLVDGSEGRDCRSWQTFAASPAEPGNLPWLSAAPVRACTLQVSRRGNRIAPLARVSREQRFGGSPFAVHRLVIEAERRLANRRNHRDAPAAPHQAIAR
jgi:hypothetical protein